MKKVLILFYSVGGTTKALAEHLAKGVESESVEAVMRTVPRVANIASLDENSLEPVPNTGSPYATLDDLVACDALLLGSPTRFGNMAAPLKHFWDSTSDIWLKGELCGKPAGVFTTSSSAHGGQETTLLSMMIPLLHHGMLIAGIPYSVPELHSTQSGGTPYGASHVGGEKCPLTENEMQIALAQGKRIAQLAKCNLPT